MKRQINIILGVLCIAALITFIYTMQRNATKMANLSVEVEALRQYEDAYKRVSLQYVVNKDLLALRNIQYEELQGEYDKNTEELNALYKNDAGTNAWATSPIPKSVIDLLHKSTSRN